MKKQEQIYFVATFVAWVIFMVTTWLLGPRSPFNAPIPLQVAWFGSVAYISLHGIYLIASASRDVAKATRVAKEANNHTIHLQYDWELLNAEQQQAVNELRARIGTYLFQETGTFLEEHPDLTIRMNFTCDADVREAPHEKA